MVYVGCHIFKVIFTKMQGLELEVNATHCLIFCAEFGIC
jgi:hypothetical protein